MVVQAPIWKNETRCYTFSARMCAKEPSYENINILDNLLSAALPLLNIQILLIFVVSNSLNFLLKRLRIPSFVGQALTGVILGPTGLGRTDFFKNKLFPHSSQTNLELIAYIGYGTFMFLVGVKMDMATFMNARKKVMTIGLGSLIFPVFVALAAQQQKINSSKSRTLIAQIIAITEVQSVTSFAVVSHLLNELRLTNSEVGRLAMSSSLIAGSCSLVFQFLTSALAKNVENHTRLSDVGGVLVAMLFASFVLRPVVISLVVKKTPPEERVNPGWVATILAMATAYEVFFDTRREAFILGPFLFGLLVVPPGPPLGSSLVQTLEPFPQAVFFPVFVAMTVMKADLGSVFSDFDGRAYFSALIFWVAVLKFGICLLLAIRWMSMLDSIVLSLIMSSKGIVDISIHAYMRDVQRMLPQLFSLFILAIVVNATVIPIVVSFLYEPTRRYARYHSKNIFELKPFTELRILTCIHKLHHVPLVTKLLDALCRTEESVVALYVIHLLEQIGHATPIFLCHQKHKKSSSLAISDSSSIDMNHVVFAFTQYERKNVGFTSLQSFTSISQYKFMQEDIFTLALDKLVSMILIPFHRQWSSVDGMVETEDNVLRTLNKRILDTAPCSVGILYDRKGFRSHSSVSKKHTDSLSQASITSSSLSVCMIYLGGRDDQEAISLAKRMVTDPTVHLTIIHMVSDVVDHGSNNNINDTVVLRGVLQETADRLNVQYLERVVSDATETTRLVSSVASQYDLFVIGRRLDIDMESPQTAGLANWSEFPELGVIGDLLASKDVQTRGSVLVVQQQKRS